MSALTCPRCGARQPEDDLSFTCHACGSDLAGDAPREASDHGEPAPEGRGRSAVPTRSARDDLPSERPSGRSVRLRPGRGRKAAVIVALAATAVGLALAARACLERTGDEPARALADRTLGPAAIEPPPVRHELPPARDAGLAGIAVAAGPPPAEPGTIRGRITWGRVVPPPTWSFLANDRNCGVTLTVPAVPTGELGGVTEALVVVIPADRPAPPTAPRDEPLVAEIRACLPSPRLLAGPPGTSVEVRTSGVAAHELRASAPLPGLPATLAPGETLRTRLPDEGTVHLVDPAHPWERITLVAVPTALSANVNPEGLFRFRDVPPGKVTLRVYTEATGPFDRTLELAPGGDAMVQIDVADELPGFGPAPVRR